MVIDNPSGSIVLTKEQAIAFGIDPNLNEQGLYIKTEGPWSIVKKVEGLCVENVYGKTDFGSKKIVSTTLHGKRSMSNPRQTGYHLDGYVSVKGKKRSAYTSSILFEVDGKLVNVGTINIR